MVSPHTHLLCPFSQNYFPCQCQNIYPQKFSTYLTNNEDEGADFIQCPLRNLSEDFDNAIDGASSNHLVVDKVRYFRDGRTVIVEIIDNASESFNGPTFTIKFKDGSSLVTSDAYLNRVHSPDI